jgi:tetratricopeptide (TPR) repeat protein
MKKISLAVLAVFVLILAFASAAQAQSAQETLNQYISDLQKNPDDTALREKIIKLVQTMKPPPSIPEDARQHFVMAQTFGKKAKDAKGYELAIDEYRQALLNAPWWPAAYNNMGIVMEQAGQYDEAISSLKLYLLTNPDDARTAQDKIYEIEAAKKLAQEERAAEEAKESSSEAIAARKQQQEQQFIKSLDGAVYTRTEEPGNGWVMNFRIEIKDGKAIVWRQVTSTPGLPYTREWTEIKGMEGQITGRQWKPESDGFWDNTCSISEDGSKITCHYESINPNNQLPPFDNIYRRE